MIGLLRPTQTIADEYLDLVGRFKAHHTLYSDTGYRIAAYFERENPGKEAILFWTDDHIVQWLVGTQPSTKPIINPSDIGKEHFLKMILGSHASVESEVLNTKPRWIVTDGPVDYVGGKADAIITNTLRTDYVLATVVDDSQIYRRK